MQTAEIFKILSLVDSAVNM